MKLSGQMIYILEVFQVDFVEEFNGKNHLFGLILPGAIDNVESIVIYVIINPLKSEQIFAGKIEIFRYASCFESITSVLVKLEQK